MKPETLEALKKSIEHWERMACGNRMPGEEVGPHCCALCRRFNTVFVGGGREESCKECPVFEKTNLKFCDGTPYDTVEDAQVEYASNTELSDPDFYDTDEFKELANQELEFLRSLLPE